MATPNGEGGAYEVSRVGRWPFCELLALSALNLRLWLSVG